MEGVFFELCLCIITALLLMIFHESLKVLVYIIKKNVSPGASAKVVSPWRVWRYIDPVGVILAVTCYVPFSRPYFFRIRDKRTNLLLGITGLCFLAAVFMGSVYVLRVQYGGIAGLNLLKINGLWEKAWPIFWQYMALLSFGMLVANLFPISTFDMGLLVAGSSSKAYLNIIKADGTIKIIFILTLLLGLIRYGGARLILMLL